MTTAANNSFAFCRPAALRPFLAASPSSHALSSRPASQRLISAPHKHGTPAPAHRARRYTPACISPASPSPPPSIPSAPLEPVNDSPDIASAPPKVSTADAIIKFTRPHTIRGTILASVAGCARAVIESPVSINWALLPRAGMGMLALLLGNAFIVGINQIYDVRVDRINKPFLPLAAKEMSTRTAWAICVASATAGLIIVRMFFSRLIFGLYSFGMCFGALYSIPPFRFRRSPVLAAVTISCVRGFLLNFGVYHATKSALGIPFAWSPPITFLAAFMTVFATVIALSKDLPDIKGDSKEGVQTFAARVGPHRMVGIVYALLAMNYAGAILTAGIAPAGAFNRAIFGIGHIVLAICLIAYMTGVRPSSQESIKKFYQFIWKLFYAEYMLFPFI